jgi:hypothetical protein
MPTGTSERDLVAGGWPTLQSEVRHKDFSGAVDKSEGVVKRHFLAAMLCSTAGFSEWWRTEALKLSR